MRHAIFETLESRQLMSVSLGGDGTLTANGTAGNDVIAVTVANRQFNVSLKTDGAPAKNYSFAAAKVKQISANGLAGKDAIKLDATVKIPSSLFTGDGDGSEGPGDTIQGGAGKDLIVVTSAFATVHGNGGDDAILVHEGFVDVFADAGNDRVVDYATGGANKFDGGSGTDTADFSAHASRLILRNGPDGSGRNDAGEGEAPFLDTQAAWRLDAFENLTGGSNDDYLYGTNGRNILTGNAGNDRIYGYGGNDELYGLTGNDQLVGGTGSDALHGGADNDLLYDKDGTKDYLNGGDGYDKAQRDVNLDTTVKIEAWIP